MRSNWSLQGRSGSRCWLEIGLVAIGLFGACTTDPLNGTVVDGSPVDKSFFFQGYTDHANEHVVLEVLMTPSLDPAVDANWAPFGDAWTSSTPILLSNFQSPLFNWHTAATPVPSGQEARWPSGGLIRTRARRIDAQAQSHVLTTFDAVTFGDCLGQHLNEDWTAIGTKCVGLGSGMVTMASTLSSPATLKPALQPDWLGRKGDHNPNTSDDDTKTYYQKWGAPATLTAFKSKYGFANGETTATYYNDGDLGLGREMHCRTFLDPPVFVGVACYVTNYSGVVDDLGTGQPAFDVDPDTVLAQAVSHQGEFATVAMVYAPANGAPNSVRFVVYQPDGTWALKAKLDSVGTHQSIPNNCLTCHGISSHYDEMNHVVDGNAKFLPFDPFSFKYSTLPGYTLSDQQDKFRELNYLVTLTSPTPAITQLIDGMYAPAAVSTAGAVAYDDYIPDAWRYANSTMAGSSTYLGIIKPGCRTCHISSVAPSYDFLEPDDWSGSTIPLIRQDVCAKSIVGVQRGHAMPQAERTSKKFWASGGRAYLISGYPVSPPDGLDACDP